jgi:ATP-dependent HslUV protease ATP-binding subunit HslU
VLSETKYAKLGDAASTDAAWQQTNPIAIDELTEADFVRIMTEPENALTRQYRALVGAEQVELEFTEDAIRAIARIAAETNSRVENIGARRLQTVMATLMEDLLFDLPKPGLGKFVVDAKVVEEKLGKVAGDDDLRRYIL